MSLRHAQIFESLRSDVLARLIEERGSIDHVYAKVPAERLREHLSIVLDKMHQFFADDDDVRMYRSFASRYVALRVGEGFTYESLIHTVVTLGDVIAQVARERLAVSPQRDLFIRAVMRMNVAHARMLASFVAEELEARLDERDALLRGVD